MRIALLLSLLAVLATAGPAHADSIVYVGEDGNVWSVTPDGSRAQRLTDDASPSNVYRSPTGASDGTIVVAGSGNRIHVLNPDGSPKSGPWGTNPENGDPLHAHVSSDGLRVVYAGFYDSPFSAPAFAVDQMTTAASDDGGCSSASPCATGWTEPRWIPGTADAALISSGDGKAISTLESDFGDNWLESTGPTFQSFDISPTGDNRVLLLTTPEDGSQSGTLELWQNAGTPPARGAGEGSICSAPLGDGRTNPRWSTDATSVVWHDAQGVWASPAPTGSGTCTLAPRVVAGGGTDPSWAWGDVPPADPGVPPGAGGAPPADAGAPPATRPRAGADRLQTLGQALRRGLKVRVECPRRCTIRVTALLDARASRRAGLGRRRTTVAKGRAVLRRAGRKVVRAKFSRRARRRLARTGRVRLTLKIRTKAGRSARTQARKVTLSR